jgi:hypothetical protein
MTRVVGPKCFDPLREGWPLPVGAAFGGRSNRVVLGKDGASVVGNEARLPIRSTVLDPGGEVVPNPGQAVGADPADCTHEQVCVHDGQPAYTDKAGDFETRDGEVVVGFGDDLIESFDGLAKLGGHHAREPIIEVAWYPAE